MTSCFLHVALGLNSLTSHSRFSNSRIIERSYGGTVELPAVSLRALHCDLFDPPGGIFANMPALSFSRLH